MSMRRECRYLVGYIRDACTYAYTDCAYMDSGPKSVEVTFTFLPLSKFR